MTEEMSSMEHTRGRINLSLGMEDGTVEGDINDGSKIASLDFDQVWLTDDDNLDGLSEITLRALETLDLRDNWNEIDIHNSYTHQN